MRLISFDTETTGLTRATGKPVCEGHRIVELGCVELSDNENPPFFHSYVNPKRAVDDPAFAVHGLSNEFLKDKPLFKSIAQDFLNFIKGATLIAHNAPFDVSFINQELALIGLPPLESFCYEIIDTLAIAKKKYPGRKNSLDALCQRLNIDLSGREFHGALKDSLLLLQVYKKMMGGQIEFEFVSESFVEFKLTEPMTLPCLTLSIEEENNHAAFVEKFF
jgi:DNA polymerase-3 subunit epsilon